MNKRGFHCAIFIVIKSGLVSKEGYCFGYCLVKQRTVCIINVWGYTEILPFLLVGMVSSCFIANMKHFLCFVWKKSSHYVEDVSELCRSTPPHPFRCPPWCFALSFGNCYMKMYSQEKPSLNEWFLLIQQRESQLSVVKPKPNQLLTSQITQPISSHSKTKTKVIA